MSERRRKLAMGYDVPLSGWRTIKAEMDAGQWEIVAANIYVDTGKWFGSELVLRAFLRYPRRK